MSFSNAANFMKNMATGNYLGAVGDGINTITGVVNGVRNFQTQQNDIGLTQDSQKAAKNIQDAFARGEIGGKEYREMMDHIGRGVDNLDQNQRDYQGQANQNRGTTGENALLSNVLANATNRQQAQQTAADQLAGAIAADPLAQYQNDADLKRRMALNNQTNLANNVRDQLTQLGAARSTNADLIKNAMSQGRQSL